MLEEELWFNLVDVSNLLAHLRHRPATEGQPPMLRLWQQDNLRYLDVNSADPQLVNPLDPCSTQRVYAHGHAHHDGNGLTSPADNHSAHAAVLVAMPATPGSDLQAAVFDATEHGHDTLSITLRGPLTHIASLLLPHPQPHGRWIDGQVALSGSRRHYRGQYLDNLTNDGYAYVRLTAETIAHLHTDLAQLDHPPAGTSPAALPDPASLPAGWHLVGQNWPWVCCDLALSELPTKFIPPLDDTRAGALPRAGEPVVYTDDRVLWLDDCGELLSRTMPGGCRPSADGPTPIDYQRLRPFEQLYMRAIEHALRLAATAAKGLAARFDAAEIEELILAAVQLKLGDEALSPTQHALLRRAQDCLDEHI